MSDLHVDAAGTNVTSDVEPMANLLQALSAFGRAMGGHESSGAGRRWPVGVLDELGGWRYSVGEDGSLTSLVNRVAAP